LTRCSSSNNQQLRLLQLQARLHLLQLQAHPHLLQLQAQLRLHHSLPAFSHTGVR
jgi:hypothetical protein